MNRTEVMEKLQPMTRVATKEVDHTARSKVVLQPDAIIIQPGDRKHSLTIPRKSEGERALAKYVGLPTHLEGNVRPTTYSMVMDDLLLKKGRYSVVTKDDQVVSFHDPDRAVSAAPERVVRAICSGIRGNVDFHRVHTNGYQVRLEVTGTREVAVQRGDLVRGGAVVNFSPIGIVAPSIQSYVLRLECTNGATSNHAISEYHFANGGSGDGDVWDWIRNRVGDAYKAVRDVADAYRRLTGENVSPQDRALVLANLIRQAGLNSEEAAAVQARAIERPPQNSYDMMNLITWASSHVVSEPRRIFRAQKAVATFVDETQHARVCPVCRSTR